MNTNAAIAPPVIRPAATSDAPSHNSMTIEPNTKAMMVKVITARIVKRRRATENAFSTALRKRPSSRSSCPNAWTTFIAPKVSDTVEPTSAMRSCDERLRLRMRRPKKITGPNTTGMPITMNPASLGESRNR